MIRFPRRAAALLLLAAATLAGAAPLAAQLPADWGRFGIQTRYQDTSARPGDDFDRFVNGKWHDTNELPADKARMGSFSILSDLSETRLRGILEELTARKWPAGSARARIAAAYAAFMDTDAIEARGLAPARPHLDRIASARTRDDLLALFATPGIAAPVGAQVFADQKDSGRYAVYFGQLGLGLPDRDFYLVDNPRFREVRARYLDYLALLLGKAGQADPRAAAEQVLALETRLAAAMWDRTVARDRNLNYTRLSLAELDALAPGGTARKLLDGLGMGGADYVIVPQILPDAAKAQELKLTGEQLARLGGGLPATIRLIDETPIATWRAWLAARFLSDHAEALPAEIDQARFAFYGTLLSGQPQQRPRWKRGIDAVESQLGELLGQIYVERYYRPAERREMAKLVANLRRAMAANLDALTWMGPDTKREARTKLDAFTTKIGAPETFKQYEGLAISATDPLGNRMAAQRWGLDYQLARIGKPVDRSEWFMLPQAVNAYYNPPFNEIVFPAAILQPPFFNLSADPAVNYGAIGAVIGHEIGHGFDDQGSKSDGTGNLRDWWTPADRAAFEALTGRLVGQYNALCPFDETSPGGKACINGALTLGENIGDIGGLSLAYRAYQLSLAGKPAPVIDGTTGDQRFFLAWAQIWRAKAREPIARQMLVTAVHAPERFRINGVVRNFDEWYRAFDVRPGDKLYLPPEQRVRIW
jgi:putative endopeptidase